MPVTCGDCDREVTFEAVGMMRCKIVCPEHGVIHDDRKQMGEDNRF
jgi:hypothetical protein